jgi:hypothetical protein
MNSSTTPLAIGILTGCIIRLWAAHGDITLFLNPWFNAFSGAKPWF